MKQIVDKLNKIAKKIDESVEIPQTDLIIDSLDAITKAYGGTPNDSNLIVDKLEDIYNNIEPAVSGNIEINENGENINVAPFATATVNVSGGGGTDIKTCAVTLVSEASVPIPLQYNFIDSDGYYIGNTQLGVNETRTMDLLISKVMSDPDNYDYVCMITNPASTPSYANNVNCTVNFSSIGAPTVNIVITDTTLPASVEIHFSLK